MAKITLTLDTSNNQRIEAKTSELTILVLGEMKTENLDSLSVTLKVSKNGTKFPPIRSSIDLYRDERVEELINTICKKLEVGFKATQDTIYQLIEQLEAYRFTLTQSNNQFEAPTNLSSKDKQSAKRYQLIEQLEAYRFTLTQSNNQFEAPTNLSSKDKQSAKRYLGKKNVIQTIKSDLEKAGVHSHNHEALLLYLSIASRKMDNPLSLCFLDDSPISKSVFDVIRHCTPESEYIYPSSISSQALYYLGLDDFKHKTMFLSDFGSKQDIHMPLSQLIQEKQLMKIVALKDKSGLPYTMRPVVQGPINLNAISTYKFEHKISKLPLLTIPISTTEADIKKWMYAKKMESAGLVNIQEQLEARNRLIHLQSILQPIKVINPYAIDIELPDSHKGDNRLLGHVLKLINTITYLNQFQREHYVQDAFGNPTESYIKTEPQDIQLAFELLKSKFNLQLKLLQPKTEQFYMFLKTWLNENGLEEFKSFQIRQSHPSLVKRSVNRHLKELLENGLVEIVSGKKNTGYSYVVKDIEFNAKEEKTFCFDDFLKDLLNDIQEKR